MSEDEPEELDATPAAKKPAAPKKATPAPFQMGEDDISD